MTDADIDPTRFEVHRYDGRGFSQAYVREGAGGVPLLCVHGWPESKRIWWRVIEPLAAAGFDVIVPDLRGFGDSDARPGRVPRRRRPRRRPARPRHRRARPRSGGALRRRPRRARSCRALALEHPELTERHGAVQLAAALRQGADGGHGQPAADGGGRLLRAPGPRRRRAGGRPRHPRAAAPLHRDLLLLAVLGPSRAPSWATPRWCSGPTAARRRSTSTPSPSATPPSCGRPSAATRACSTRPSRAGRRASSGTRPCARCSCSGRPTT